MAWVNMYDDSVKIVNGGDVEFGFRSGSDEMYSTRTEENVEFALMNSYMGNRTTLASMGLLRMVIFISLLVASHKGRHTGV